MASYCGYSYVSSLETTNYARICRIVVDVFRDILFQVLTNEILPADLPNKAQTNYKKLGNLDNKIKNLLFGRSAASIVIPRAVDFDVSSLYTLIRNLCGQVLSPSTKWGEIPQASAIKVGDDIERIREFRNSLYGHATEAKIEISKFNKHCTDIKDVVSRFDAYFQSFVQPVKCDFVSVIDVILTCSMDKDMEDDYIEKVKEVAVLSDGYGDVKKTLLTVQYEMKDGFGDVKKTLETFQNEMKDGYGDVKNTLETVQNEMKAVSGGVMQILDIVQNERKEKDKRVGMDDKKDSEKKSEEENIGQEKDKRVGMDDKKDSEKKSEEENIDQANQFSASYVNNSTLSMSAMNNCISDPGPPANASTVSINQKTPIIKPLSAHAPNSQPSSVNKVKQSSAPTVLQSTPPAAAVRQQSMEQNLDTDAIGGSVSKTKPLSTSAKTSIRSLTHCHTTGEVTSIRFGEGQTPNLQVGSHNVMVVNDSNYANGVESKPKPETLPKLKLTDQSSPAMIEKSQNWPITGVVIVADAGKCPPGFSIICKTYDSHEEADLWREEVFGRRVTRFLCVERSAPQLGKDVLVDMAIIRDTDQKPADFTVVGLTHDTREKAMKHQHLCIRWMSCTLTNDAISEIIFLNKGAIMPPLYTLVGKLSDLELCYRKTSINVPQNVQSTNLNIGLKIGDHSTDVPDEFIAIKEKGIWKSVWKPWEWPGFRKLWNWFHAEDKSNIPQNKKDPQEKRSHRKTEEQACSTDGSRSTDASQSKCSTKFNVAYELTNPFQKSPNKLLTQPSQGNLKAELDRTDSVYNQWQLVNLAKSIGIIKSPSICGTGFRVGPNYVMTAKHVIDGILKGGPVPFGQQEQPKHSLLRFPNFCIDFSYQIPNCPADINYIFSFEEIVYENQELDVAILRLKSSDNAYPPPIINFSQLQQMEGDLYLIGHSKGDIKKTDKFSCASLDSNFQISAGYEGVNNPHCQLLHCTFEKGASGAPGVWICPNDDKPYVVLMLIKGYPDWYYDEKTPPEKKSAIIPHVHCIEQGVLMEAIYNELMKVNSSLTSEIFHYKPAESPTPLYDDVEMKSQENC